jgi:hypothetical protein
MWLQSGLGKNMSPCKLKNRIGIQELQHFILYMARASCEIAAGFSCGRSFFVLCEPRNCGYIQISIKRKGAFESCDD